MHTPTPNQNMKHTHTHTTKHITSHTHLQKSTHHDNKNKKTAISLTKMMSLGLVRKVATPEGKSYSQRISTRKRPVMIKTSASLRMAVRREKDTWCKKSSTGTEEDADDEATVAVGKRRRETEST